MNKQELVSKVAEKVGLTKKDTGVVVDAVFESIVEGLKAEGEVKITDFGKFSVKERAARQGRNPKTGETIQIEATKVPAFKALKGLKEAVK